MLLLYGRGKVEKELWTENWDGNGSFYFVLLKGNKKNVYENGCYLCCFIVGG